MLTNHTGEGNFIESTNPMTRKKIMWKHVDPVEWLDPPLHLQGTDDLVESVFNVGLNRDEP
jgi:hypothetical protein